MGLPISWLILSKLLWWYFFLVSNCFSEYCNLIPIPLNIYCNTSKCIFNFYIVSFFSLWSFLLTLMKLSRAQEVIMVMINSIKLFAILISPTIKVLYVSGLIAFIIKLWLSFPPWNALYRWKIKNSSRLKEKIKQSKTEKERFVSVSVPFYLFS